MEKYMFSYHFKKIRPKFDIIVIIMLYFGVRKFELSLEDSSIFHVSLGNGL
jgi:hypothetical protein